MLWPFHQFRTSPALRGTIETIYGAIVTQSRAPVFYADFGVADTLNGRFDMLVLHMWLTLRRLGEMGDTKGMGQALIDHFYSDMDDNLRELGTSDLKVPKRLLEFNEAFYGRVRAYDAALAADDSELLAAALDRNIYDSQSIDGARGLAHYVLRTVAALETFDMADSTRGDLRFPPPSKGEAA